MSTWLLVLVIAIPFLFLIGVVNNAVKDQKKLEQRHNKFMEERGAVPSIKPDAYDDDDWGVPARQDLKRKMEEAPDAFKKKEEGGKQHAANYFAKYNREDPREIALKEKEAAERAAKEAAAKDKI